MTPLLDPETMASLRSLQEDAGDPTLLKTLGSTFIEDTEKRFGMVRSALTAGLIEPAGSQAHALKSSAANLGALGMSELCKELEQLAKGGKPAAELTAVFAKIEAQWPALKAELERECGLR